METISNTLFWISNGLLVPVVVLLCCYSFYVPLSLREVSSASSTSG